MISVLQVNKAYHPHTGGVETVVRQLAEGLSARGFNVRVLACGKYRKTVTSLVNGVSVQSVGSLATVLSLPISPTFPSWLSRYNADIVHIHEPFPLGNLAYLMLGKQAQNKFRRLVVWWHSDIIRQKLFLFLYRPLLMRYLKLADAICVATPKHISSSGFLPRFADKCYVIPYGVDLQRFVLTPETKVKRDQYREMFGPEFVLFVGRLVYYKGVDVLVKSLAHAPKAHLVIVGTGPLEHGIKQLANAIAPGRVTILSPVDESDLISLYHACSIFVLPSVANSEAFGIVQLEAMACGKPVITSDLPTGVTYVNQAGKTGLVVPVGDPVALGKAIQTLLDNVDLRYELGETARQRVKADFTVDRMVQQTAELYRSLLTP